MACFTIGFSPRSFARLTPMNPRRATALLTAGLAALALAGCASGTPAATPTPSATAAATVTVGSCFDQPSHAKAPTVVDCAKPHENEAYYSITVEGDSFPGDDLIKSQAATGCETAFSGFVGIDYADTALSISFFYPTESSWSTGDREILCVVYDPAGKTTGSLEATAK